LATKQIDNGYNPHYLHLDDFVHLSDREWTILNLGVADKRTPGLGSRYVTAALYQSNIAAACLNFSGGDIPYEIINELPQNSIVGIHGMTGSPLKRAIAVTRFLRRNRPDVLIVWGGPLCQSHPQSLAGSGLADIIVLGEAEPFVSAIGSASFEGIHLSNIYETPLITVPPLKDLDTLPGLTDFFPVSEMVYSNNRFGDIIPTYDIQISRGCWGTCDFCYVKDIPYRIRSPQHLEKELRALSGVSPEFIRFIDDTFPLNEALILMLERWISDITFKPIFFCELRLDQLHRRDLLKRFAAIGLRDVFVGVESGDARQLKTLNKTINIRAIQSTANFLLGQGINMYVGLLLNVRNQSMESLSATLRMACTTDATAYYPAFVKDYHDSSENVSLDNLASEEWLDLDKNVTVDLSDNILFNALLRLKTIHLVKAIINTRLNPDCPQIIKPGANAVHIHSGQLFLRPDRIRVNAIEKALESPLCSHSECAALLLWSITDCHVIDKQMRYSIATHYLSHKSYHVRALALGVIYNAYSRHLPIARSVISTVRHLRNDKHVFVQVIANRVFHLLETSS